MAASLVSFVERDLPFRSRLNLEQIKIVQEWARKVPTTEEHKHLSSLRKLSRGGLQRYLTKIIPNYPLKKED